MTFCKILKSAQVGPDTVEAYECYDKYVVLPRYEIVVSRDGIAHTVTRTAKTTWRKKFREMTGQ